VKEEVNAKKTRFDGDEALGLIGKVSKVYVAKGKKVVHFDLKKDRPDDETLLKHLIGPTGNLRAPTMIVGKTMLVGYHAEPYETVFS